MDTDLRDLLQSSLRQTHAIERELDGGGMSRVFVAHELRLGRTVVVKVLSAEHTPMLSAERFEREISIVARLQNPRIVPILSAGEVGGLPFYIMPYVDGESLRQRMRRNPPTSAEATAILRDIALALVHAHDEGIIHRDIKPENILLSRGTAVVTDFGIARAISSSTYAGRHDSLTQVGLVLGTPAYMAPEQATGGVVDHRADIYSWGVVAYELLAGVHPFAGRASSQSMIAAHIVDEVPPLAARVPALSPTLAALVEAALRKDPTLRPATAASVVAALDAAATGSEPSGRRAMLTVLALVLAAGLTSALLLRTHSEQNGTRSRLRSIAVAPFISIGSDSVSAYLGEGIADELVTTLTTLPDLRVLTTRSTRQERGERIAPGVIGRDLNVDAMLDGTLQRADRVLRVRVTLTSVADGSIIWSRTYDRHAGDVFGLQDEVSTAIAVELRGTLSGRRAYFPEGVPRGTRDARAYDLFLRARYAWSRRGARELQEAISLFQQALARDSGFARAYAGLAMSYVVLPIFSRAFPPDSALILAQRNGERALEIDSTLADAHLAIANHHKMRWQWQDAARHFAAALALAPDDATAHHWYGVFLSATGKVNEAVRELALARSLDPFTSSIGWDGAIALYASRRYAESRAEINRAFVLDTTKADIWFATGLIQLAQGHADSAVRSMEIARLMGSGFEMRPFLSVAHRALGNRTIADATYAEIRRDYASGRAKAYEMTVAAAGAGDRAAALESAERIVQQRDIFVTELSFPCDPLLDSLKSDPRFVRLLVDVGMTVCLPSARSR